MIRTGRVGDVCAQPKRDTAGNAARLFGQLQKLGRELSSVAFSSLDAVDKAASRAAGAATRIKSIFRLKLCLRRHQGFHLEEARRLRYVAAFLQLSTKRVLEPRVLTVHSFQSYCVGVQKKSGPRTDDFRQELLMSRFLAFFDPTRCRFPAPLEQ